MYDWAPFQCPQGSGWHCTCLSLSLRFLIKSRPSALANVYVLNADRLQRPNRSGSEHSAFPPIVDERLLLAGPRLKHVDLCRGVSQLLFQCIGRDNSHASTKESIKVHNPYGGWYWLHLCPRAAVLQHLAVRRRREEQQPRLIFQHRGQRRACSGRRETVRR